MNLQYTLEHSALQLKNVPRMLCSVLKRQKVCAFVLIVCLISGLTPTAESVSVKLKGKIVLGGILSGLACATYALITRDKRATEKLQLHLGPPDRVIQFERGFDRWRINYYGEQCYLFRNNLFIETVPCTSLQSGFSDRWIFAPSAVAKRSGAKREGRPFKSPFLIDIPVSSSPKWLRLYLSRPQRAPQFVSSYLYRSGAERSLGRELSLSR